MVERERERGIERARETEREGNGRIRRYREIDRARERER